MAGGGVGNKQIINGQTYSMYSPEWYSAQRANEVQKGTTAGQTAGAAETGFLGSLPPSLSGLIGAGATGTASAIGSATGGAGSSGTGGAFGTGAGPTGAGGGTGGSGSGSGGGSIAAPTMPDPTAMDAQQFARAKDTVGQTGRASIDALNGELGASGMMGGGAQVQGTRDVVNAGQEQLGKVASDQATANAATAADFAKTGYEGAIAQRGQNIQASEAASQLALAQNNAAFQQSYLRQQQLQNMLQMALSGLSGGGGGSGVATNPNLY